MNKLKIKWKDQEMFHKTNNTTKEKKVITQAITTTSTEESDFSILTKRK